MSTPFTKKVEALITPKMKLCIEFRLEELKLLENEYLIGLIYKDLKDADLYKEMEEKINVSKTKIKTKT